MKLGVSHCKEEHLTDRHFSYLRQMGIEQIEVCISARNTDLAHLQEIKKQVESAGLELFEIKLYDLYNFPACALGLAGWKEETAEFIRFLENLGRIGIRNTTYTWCSGGTYSTGETIIRECATREFRLSKALAAQPAYRQPYTEEEMIGAFIAPCFAAELDSGPTRYSCGLVRNLGSAPRVGSSGSNA